MTKDQIEELLEYRDGGLYWKVSNRASVSVGRRVGCIHHSGYRHFRIFGKLYREHRVIFFLHHGYFPEFVDHIDGDRQNNRIENLREATKSQNNMNAKLRKDNTSGIKGVSWHKQHKKWYVCLNLNRKQKFIGLFDDLELAELVSIEAKDKYHKEFARHE